MKRIILTYGLIAGTIVIASAILGLELVEVGESETMANLEYVGYLVMLVALSVIFVGIKKYRDQELGGVITFGTAALVGLGISAIAGVVYVAVWEVYLVMTNYAFMDDYVASVIAAKEAEGVAATELQETIASMEAMREQYRNPLFRLPITFLEIFPVGVLITLISSAFLRKSENLPAEA